MISWKKRVWFNGQELTQWIISASESTQVQMDKVKAVGLTGRDGRYNIPLNTRRLYNITMDKAMADQTIIKANTGTLREKWDSAATDWTAPVSVLRVDTNVPRGAKGTVNIQLQINERPTEA